MKSKKVEGPYYTFFKAYSMYRSVQAVNAKYFNRQAFHTHIKQKIQKGLYKVHHLIAFCIFKRSNIKQLQI
jgi:hypothetical protein